MSTHLVRQIINNTLRLSLAQQLSILTEHQF